MSSNYELQTWNDWVPKYLIGLFMFFRKSSDQDYQQPQDYLDEYPTQ